MSRSTSSSYAAILLCSICLSALGCEQKNSDETTAPSPAAVAPVAPSEPAVAAPVLSAADVPIVEDFEAEAEQQINDTSYKQALAELAREIDADTRR